MWLEQKRRGGRKDVLASGHEQMYEFLLRPMGVAAKPHAVSVAIDDYMEARSVLERRFGLSVPRTLEGEVRPTVLRAETS